MVTKTIRQLFGIPADVELEVGAKPIPPHEGGVQVRKDYLFAKDLIRSMLTFWDLSEGDTNLFRACMLHGPKGSGKTTIVEQWHARLNRALLCTTGNGKVEAEELIGSLTLDQSGAVVWSDGLLVKAARRGCSLLINEINTIEPDVLIALNDICQPGSSFTIPQTGEVIKPAPGFRVFGTCNPAGGLYMGRKELDPSTKRRFFHIEVGYPSPEVETKLIEAVLLKGGVEGADAPTFAAKLVGVAAAVRARSIEVSDANDAIPETLSTDELIKWATVWCKLHGTPNALTTAIDHVLLNACDQTVRKAIRSHIATAFGATA